MPDAWDSSLHRTVVAQSRCTCAGRMFAHNSTYLGTGTCCLEIMACPLPFTSSFLNEHQLPTATSLSNKLDAIMGVEEPSEAFLEDLRANMLKKDSVQELKSVNKRKTSRRRATGQARHSSLDASSLSLLAALAEVKAMQILPSAKAIQLLPSAIQSCPKKVNKKVRFAEPPKRTTENKYITSLDLARPPVRPGRKAFLTNAHMTASHRPSRDPEPDVATSPSTFGGEVDHQPRKKGKKKEFGKLRKPANTRRRHAIRVWKNSIDFESLQTLLDAEQCD
jgi:hypothetical protein